MRRILPGMEKGPPATAMVSLKKADESDTISRELRSIGYNLSYYINRGKNTKVSEGMLLTERFTKVLKDLDEEIYRDKACPREKFEKFAKVVDVFKDLTKVVSVKVNTVYRVPMELVKARGTVANVLVSLVSVTKPELKANVDILKLNREARKYGAFSTATIKSGEPAYQAYIEMISESLKTTDKVFASAKIMKTPKSALLIR